MVASEGETAFSDCHTEIPHRKTLAVLGTPDKQGCSDGENVLHDIAEGRQLFGIELQCGDGLESALWSGGLGLLFHQLVNDALEVVRIPANLFVLQFDLRPFARWLMPEMGEDTECFWFQPLRRCVVREDHFQLAWRVQLLPHLPG